MIPRGCRTVSRETAMRRMPRPKCEWLLDEMRVPRRCAFEEAQSSDGIAGWYAARVNVGLQSGSGRNGTVRSGGRRIGTVRSGGRRIGTVRSGSRTNVAWRKIGNITKP